LSRAQKAMGEDSEGYRSNFLEMVMKAKDLPQL